MLDTLRKSINEMMERHRQQPFLEGCMATAALAAMADGDVSFSEQTNLDQAVEAIDRLALFDAHEATDLFNYYAEAMRQNHAKGREQALGAIARMAKDPEAASILVRVYLAISASDAVIKSPPAVQQDILDLCASLHLSPEDYANHMA